MYPILPSLRQTNPPKKAKQALKGVARALQALEEENPAPAVQPAPAAKAALAAQRNQANRQVWIFNGARSKPRPAMLLSQRG